jgi:hypothetical protein
MDDDFAPQPDVVVKVEPGAARNGKRKQPADDETECFVMSCEVIRKKGKRWCHQHNCNYDGMAYQAKHATPPRSELMESIMSDRTSATEAMEEWDRENPPHKKYQTKKHVQWSNWERKMESSSSVLDRDGCEPVESREFYLWGTNTKGWSGEETRGEWQRLLKCCETDKKGLNGAQRLWIPRIEQKSNEKCLKTSSALVQGHTDKNMGEDERGALAQHMMGLYKMNVGGQAASFLGGDKSAFEKGSTGPSAGAPLSSPGKAKQVKAEQKDESEDEKPMVEGAKEKRARVRLEKLGVGAKFTSHRAEVFVNMEATIDKCSAKMIEVQEKLGSALKVVEHNLQKDSDLVLTEYVKGVKAATDLGSVWKGVEVLCPIGFTSGALASSPAAPTSLGGTIPPSALQADSQAAQLQVASTPSVGTIPPPALDAASQAAKSEVAPTPPVGTIPPPALDAAGAPEPDAAKVVVSLSMLLTHFKDERE